MWRKAIGQAMGRIGAITSRKCFDHRRTACAAPPGFRPHDSLFVCLPKSCQAPPTPHLRHSQDNKVQESWHTSFARSGKIKTVASRQRRPAYRRAFSFAAQPKGDRPYFQQLTRKSFVIYYDFYPLLFQLGSIFYRGGGTSDS